MVKIGQYHALKISLKYHNIFWILQYRDISKWCNILHSRSTFRKNIVISTAGALRIGVVRDFRPSYHPSNHPFIAFDHLSLKRIEASLWHYVAFSGKVNHGRPRYSQVQSGTVRYSQVQCWKDPSCAIYFWKAGAFASARISNSRNKKKQNFLKLWLFQGILLFLLFLLNRGSV